MVVEARQSFQFFRQKIWFLGNNRALSVKTNFKLTTRVILIAFILVISKKKIK